MKSAAFTGGEVLRGLQLAGAPLRLGRARATVAAAAGVQAVIDDPAQAQEEALREARALATRKGHEEGLRSGRIEGLREGRAQAAEEIREAVQRAVAAAESECKAQHERLQRIAQQAEGAMADVVSAAHDEIVALCYETLCRMLGASALEPRLVRAQFAQLLEHHGPGELVLHVHPQDAELLQRGEAAAPASGVRWLADPAVALGGCILASAGGALDARLETMLEACKAALLEARAQAGQQPPDGEAA